MYSKLTNGTNTPPWINHLSAFVKNHNITPEKLYWLITGSNTKTDKTNLRLDKRYIRVDKLIEFIEDSIVEEEK
jgi:hypothetical protein